MRPSRELRQLEDQIYVPDQASEESEFNDPPTNPMHGLPEQARDKNDEENQHAASNPVPAPEERNRADGIEAGLDWVVAAPSDNQNG